MRKIVTLCAAALLGACSTPSMTGADRYHFTRAPVIHDSVQVTVVYHDTVQDLITAAQAESPDIPNAPRRLPEEFKFAWAKINGNACEVHMINPTINYQPEWLGHEVMHCIHGAWHD